MPRRPVERDQGGLRGDLHRFRGRRGGRGAGRREDGFRPRREQKAEQLRVGDFQLSGLHVGIPGGRPVNPQALPDFRAGENHSATLPPAVVVVVKAVRASVGHHGVGQDALVGDVVDALQLPQQFLQGFGLGGGDVPVVVPADLDPDRVVVDVASPLPHAPARVAGDLGLVDDAEHLAGRGDEIMGLPVPHQLVEGALFLPLGGVEDDVARVRPLRTLAVQGAQPVGDPQGCGGRHPDGHAGERQARGRDLQQLPARGNAGVPIIHERPPCRIAPPPLPLPGKARSSGGEESPGW